MNTAQTTSTFDHAFLNAFGVSWQDVGYSTAIRKDTSLKEALAKPFRNDFFIVLVIARGSLRVSINLLEHTMTQADMLLLMPGTIFEIHDCSADLQISSLLADKDFFGKAGLHSNGKEAFEFFAVQHNVVHLCEQECKVINCLLEVMQHEAVETDAVFLRKDIARHTFLAFILELGAIYRRYNVNVRAKVNRKEELTLGLMQLLTAHFREERSVQFYADKLFVTAKYLAAAIKEVTGKTPGALIDEVVITEAKILLTNTGNNVAQIAEQLNFSDQSFFGKYFKKHTGYSPSEFRAAYWAS